MDAVIKIYGILEWAGIPVFLPNQATGKCKEPYCVVKDMGQSGDFNNYLGSKMIEILTYVPKSKYASMVPLKDLIKEALKEEAWLKRTGQEQQVIYLDNIDGYMSSIEYKISKKL